MGTSIKFLTWLLLLAGSALPVAAQTPTRLGPKPAGKPTVITGPTALTAQAGATYIVLLWPAVTGATGYRVTRTNNAGQQETQIYQGPKENFVFEGTPCSPNGPCIYQDAAVTRDFLYSYRVYSLFSTTVSSPSPVASARLK